MRIVIFVLVIVVLAFIAALATGYLDIDQLRGAKAPQLSTTDNGVVAQGGQTPTFDVQTGSVRIGAQEKTVKVPKLVVEKPGENQAAAATTNNSM
ncbi:MAG TPA: hypothetical protein VFK19_04955 [Sphingomicrobium sp.]|nr:hypothetical protein [Sphingomicrobium sp.]